MATPAVEPPRGAYDEMIALRERDPHLAAQALAVPTVDDVGTKMDIVVSGNRGWKNATALRLGIIALVFAALCLSLAIMLPLGQRAEPRAGRR